MTESCILFYNYILIYSKRFLFSFYVTLNNKKKLSESTDHNDKIL